MDTALVEQMFQLFPHIEENFLLGLCDAYKEDNLEVDEMVDVVFSFEHPPLKKVDNDACKLQTNESDEMQAHSDNFFAEIITEILENNVFKKDELIVSSSSANNIIDETNTQIFNQNCNETENNCTGLEEESCDNNILSKSKIHPDLTCKCSLDKKQTCIMLSTELTPFNETLVRCATKGSPDLSDLEETNETNENQEKDSTNLISFNFLKGGENNENKNTSKDQVKLLFLELPFGIIDENVPQVKNVDINCDKSNTQDKKMVSSNKVTSLLNDNKTLSGEQLLKNFEFRKLAVELNYDVTSTEHISNDEPCINHPSSSNTKISEADTTVDCAPLLSDHEFQPVSIVEKPLCDGLKVVCPKQSTVNTKCVSVVPLSETQPGTLVHENKSLDSPFACAESKYSLLCKVLPDADEKYLFAQSMNISSSDELLLFISNIVDNKMYPKKKKLEEDIPEVLGFDCTVEEFLQYIPDPSAEFKSANYTRTGYEGNAEVYLKSRYQTLSAELLTPILFENNYNLVKICQELDSVGYAASPHCWENIILHHSPSAFFHQEVWYIEHKTEIQNYLNNVIEAAKLEEELNKPLPPTVEEVFECTICRDEILEYSDLGSCDGPAGHLFCKNCIKRHTEIQMGEAKTTFTCLNNCGGFIHLQTIKEVLPSHTFDILMKKVLEEEIRQANIPGVETCPFCPYAYGPGEEDPVFICLNSDCLKQSCRTCRKEDHFGMCDMFKSDDEEAARHFVENKMTEALVRNCYNCGKGIVKHTGCNKMQCVCGAKMCYICRQPVQDYTHFNGQGGDNYDRCELFSDDITLHDQPVAATAKQAFDQLAANNPQLNLNPEKIIPK